MKRRKGSLLQRTLAMLLAAVLTAGMISNAVPASVLAQEGNVSENISGNDGELTGEETEPVETPKPEAGAGQETPKPDAGTGTEEETEHENISEETAVDEENGNLQTLLERIAALPDAAEYLAAEPDVDSGEADEDAYAQWMSGLYAYAQEALAIQEEIEKLTEEQRAQISEEELQKLAAWAATAQTAGESTQVMTTETTSGTCGANVEWTLADGVLTISGSGAINSYAFDGKNDIKTVVINEGVTSIGMYAFKNCSSLTSITIPASVKSIVTCAFYNCSSLTNITISEGVTSIGGNAFYSCSSLTSITIPASVTSIDTNVFHKCSNLTKVELLGELTAIKSCAFWECSSLKSITIPDSVKSIGNSAFDGCSSLTGITIPEGVTSIGQSAFDSCSSLESITIPASVTSIGGSAFYGCSSLATVTMESEVPPTLDNSNVFYKCECTNGSTKGIHVPVGTADTYKQATNWSTYKNNITDGTHSHAWSSGWTTNETHHWHECTMSDCPITDNADKGSYGAHIYDNDSDVTCNTCGYTRTLPDTQPPTGEIKIGGSSWKSFLDADSIAFGRFYKKTEQATITAADTGSGVDKIYYYISDSAMTLAEVEKNLGDKWTEGTSFSIAPDRKCVVYVKITDKAGNAKYLSSYGLVFDATAPVITGVTNGETYHASQTVTVTDALSGVKSVTVDGTEVTLTDNQFTLQTAENSHTIVATDNAGNTTTVTVNYKEPVSDADKVAAAKTVVENTLAGFTATNDTTQASIQDVINTALSDAGITDVTVEIDKFQKSEATTSAAGYINGVIFIRCGEESETINGMGINGGPKPIAQLTNPGGGSGGDHSGGSGDSGSGNNNSDNGGSNNNSDSGSGSSGGNNNDGSGNSGSSAGDNDSNVGSGSSVTNTPVEIPEIRITTPQEELEDVVLAETEKQQKAGGADIRIELDVDVVTAEASVADRALVEEALHGSAAGYTVGQYLDIRLYKVMGDSRTAIRETDGKLTIRIDVPDSLKNTDNSRTRTFAVIRVHEGRTEFLADLDNDADTITIETDRFSTYAVVFKDEAAGAAKPNSGKDAEPKTGDATPLELYATLSMIAGFTYLLVYFSDRKRGMTEETKRELVSRLVGWAKQGGKLRKCLALAAIFVLLVYYHSTRKLYRSIGKKTCVEWREIYGK